MTATLDTRWSQTPKGPLRKDGRSRVRFSVDGRRFEFNSKGELRIYQRTQQVEYRRPWDEDISVDTLNTEGFIEMLAEAKALALA